MAVTCTHYRFGNDDGTEITHTFKANLDTNPTHDWAWATFLLRLTEQCDGTAASNEAATFTYKKNGGAPVNITTTSAGVKSVTPAAWANGANCTKRLTGTGTFETTGAGCTTDGTSGGTANDIVASGNSETEIALQFVQADLANGDVITFQITGSPAAITMSVNPSVTIVMGAIQALAGSVAAASVTSSNAYRLAFNSASSAGVSLISGALTVEASLIIAALAGSVVAISVVAGNAFLEIFMGATTTAVSVTSGGLVGLLSLGAAVIAQSVVTGFVIANLFMGTIVNAISNVTGALEGAAVITRTWLKGIVHPHRRSNR